MRPAWDLLRATQPEVPAPVDGFEPAAIRDPQVPRIVVTRAPAQHAVVVITAAPDIARGGCARVV